jgi:hypothetical protein
MINKKLINIIILIFIIITVSIISCEKSKDNKIEGIWQLVNIADINSEIKEEWTFIDNNLTILEKIPDTAPDTIGTANYMVEAKLFKTLVPISNFSGDSAKAQFYNGDWEIINFSKKKMRIVNCRDGRNLTFREFMKE